MLLAPCLFLDFHASLMELKQSFSLGVKCSALAFVLDVSALMHTISASLRQSKTPGSHAGE